ncbi:MAG: hypothetical protein WDN69_13815 [Aliidongia sp.]
MSRRQCRFLRYWALNICIARRSGTATPGFSYEDAEWDRLFAIARTVSGSSVGLWFAATAFGYIALAAVLMVGVLAPLLSLLWPDPATLPASAFFALLALMGITLLGVGMPLSLAWGGALADWFAGTPDLAREVADAALLRKVQRQFWRIAIFAALSVIPVSLLMTALGAEAGWVPTILNLAAAASVLLGMIARALERRRLRRDQQ